MRKTKINKDKEARTRRWDQGGGTRKQGPGRRDQ